MTRPISLLIVTYLGLALLHWYATRRHRYVKSNSLHQGEQWPTQEATDLFFGISKLFQNKDASLRQMVYLVLKELAPHAQDVIMVTSSVCRPILSPLSSNEEHGTIIRDNH